MRWRGLPIALALMLPGLVQVGPAQAGDFGRPSPSVFDGLIPKQFWKGPIVGHSIFPITDLEEELPKGVRRQLNPDEFAGMRILAMNVKKLNNDNANPSVYRARLNSWQQQVKSHGSKEFAVVLEPEKLDELLEH